MKLRASYWTWKIINGQLSAERMPTAYLMLDGKCVYDCAYCTHARNSSSDERFLSRILWKEIDSSGLSKLIAFKRVCIQVVNYARAHEDAISLIGLLNKTFASLTRDYKPLISVSTRISNLQQVDEYFSAGADNLGIALDVVAPRLYSHLRNGNFQNTVGLLIEASKKYPGRITTHIIVGLGETDIQIFDIFKLMKQHQVQIALFAFTPVKGTKLQNHPIPSLERYRKVQLLRFLIFELDLEPNVTFDNNGYIADIKVPEELLEITKKAYLTSGCSFCTRPYYNDKPTNAQLFNLFDETLAH
uniref:Radical SAM protein n=1 Tax=Fervidobacterium thailandense TaxID=1008305 RepID=A0A7C5VM50_9BACT